MICQKEWEKEQFMSKQKAVASCFMTNLAVHVSWMTKQAQVEEALF